MMLSLGTHVKHKTSEHIRILFNTREIDKRLLVGLRRLKQLLHHVRLHKAYNIIYNIGPVLALILGTSWIPRPVPQSTALTARTLLLELLDAGGPLRVLVRQRLT